MWNSNSRSRRICKKDIRYNQWQFKKPSDPTIWREGQLQQFLRTLKNKGFCTDESYDKIYPSGSKPAPIYGLLKIHKLNINKDNLVKIISTSYYFIYRYL